MRDRRKGNLIWVIITCFAGIFAVISFQVNELMVIQNDMVNDLSEVEYLSSSTQRLSRMIITNNKDNRVIFYIDEQTNKFLNVNSVDHLSVLKEENIREIASDVIDNWETLYHLFQLSEDDSEATYDVDSIILAADNHFNSMTDLALVINKENMELNETIESMQLNSYMILVMIAFSIVNHIASTSIALKRSMELASIASLDMATGLYNRSKCQELFKDSYLNGREQQPAVVVIDLNDLKKTNDIQGHRVGDELISTFASILKEAVNVHKHKPFLGRYGGDEFVVYHKDVEGAGEIEAFLKELAFSTEEFNRKESKKFTVSYAIGYAINTEGKDGLGTRQLFDEADENMYSNKKKMKQAQSDEND